MEAPGAPSVEAVSSGRWHCSAEQCRDLIAVLNDRLEEHQSIYEANLAHGDYDVTRGIEGGP